MSDMPSYTPPPPPPPPGGSYTPPPPPPPGAPAAGGDRTIMLVLAYLGPLALIPLLTKKEDADVQWHAKNGLGICVAEIAIIFVWVILEVLVLSHLGCLSWLLGTTMNCVFAIACLAIFIIAVMKALRGERLRIPFVTDFVEKM